MDCECQTMTVKLGKYITSSIFCQNWWVKEDLSKELDEEPSLYYSTMLRALHYLFSWIRFLEIDNLYNVITKNLTLSTNRELISVNSKV